MIPLRHIDAYLQDSRAGSGRRQFVVMEERGKRTRLFYVPFCQAFWVATHDLSRVKELTLNGLSKRIRNNRADRRRYRKLGKNITWSVNATREVLRRLAEGRALSAAEKADDKHDEEYCEFDEEIEMEGTEHPEGDNQNENEKKDITSALASVKETEEKTETEPAADAVNEESEPVSETIPEEEVSDTQTGETEMAKNATAKKTKAPKAPKAPKPKGERGPRKSFAPDKHIKLLVKENPRRGAAAERFALIRDGMTVEAYGKAVVKAGSPENYGQLDLYYYVGKGWISVA